MAKSNRKETFEQLRKRSRSILAHLKSAYRDAQVALDHSSPLQLLIATILSAQCTDERVNRVTPQLFAKYQTARHFAGAKPEELEAIIRPTGFYRAKARNIIRCCQGLVENHAGKVPETMEELVQLAGVGRKTANVILGNLYEKAEGIVVDTHVQRLAQRLGFSKHQDANKIERDLMSVIPKDDWIAIGNLGIWHGRKVCQARTPRCPECVINHLCPSADEYEEGKARRTSP